MAKTWDMSNLAVAMIAVAGVLVLAVIVVCVIIVLKRRRKKNKISIAPSKANTSITKSISNSTSKLSQRSLPKHESHPQSTPNVRGSSRFLAQPQSGSL